MLHAPDKWSHTIHRLSEQYRSLADWMEKHELIPYHVGVNWSRDTLIIHLREENFLRIFQGKQAKQTSDAQGTTWTLDSEKLIFTCFIPHPLSKHQTLIQLPSVSHKESA